MTRLHSHLRQGIEYEPVSVDPDDILEEVEDEDYDTDEGAARRGRIAKIANQYIRYGRAPLILSAGLKGPLDKGWKNPWSNKNHGRGKAIVRRAGHERDGVSKATRLSKEPKRQVAENKKRAAIRDTAVQSRETSRGLGLGQGSAQPLEDNYVSFATSIAPQAHLGDTKSFVTNVEHTIVGASGGNSQWLRRPDPGIGKLLPSNHDPTPTRAQKGRRNIDNNGGLRLASPKRSLAPPHLEVTVPGSKRRKLSTSTSMLMTPNAESTHAFHPGERNDGSRNFMSGGHGIATKSSKKSQQADAVTGVGSGYQQKVTLGAGARDINNIKGARVVGIDPDDLAGEFVGTTRDSAALMSIDEPSSNRRVVYNTNQERMEEKNTHHQSSPRSRTSSTDITKPFSTPSADAPQAARAILISAQRSGQAVPRSYLGKKSRKTRDEPDAFTVQHNNATLPTKSMSNESVPGRVEGAKILKAALKSKPRPVTFSSPVANPDQRPLIDGAQQMTSSVGEVSARRRDVYEFPSDEERHQSLASHHNSGYSTQAAMVLAQIEFQESTMALETPGPRLVEQDETVVPNAETASPVFTPFRTFNEDLGGEKLSETTLQGALLSTQDLFSAVSPFAAGTIKKGTRPPPSNLRFTMMASGERVASAAKSPTRSERMPLKDKNSRVSFTSTWEKDSPDSAFRSPKLLKEEGGAPQLDFGASKEEVNVDLEFPARFLLNLGDVT